MKRSITSVLFLSLLAVLSSGNARPLCNDDQVLNAVYQNLDQTISMVFGVKSYKTMRVVTLADSPTDTRCMVEAAVDATALPAGVTFKVPYTLSDEGGDTMLYVDTGNIAHGIDINALRKGVKETPDESTARINAKTGYDRALAECASRVSFTPLDYGNSEPPASARRSLEKRDACFAKYPHLIEVQRKAEARLQALRPPNSSNYEQDSGDSLSQERWNAEQEILALKRQIAEQEAELAEIDRQLAASKPDHYED